jgi:hypothetical protein
MTCDRNVLEALAFGELEATAAAAIERHAASCDACRDELAWLRAERAAFGERAELAGPVPPALWAGVAAAIDRPSVVRSLVRALLPARQDQLRWFGLGMATAAAVAAVLTIAVANRPGDTADRVAVATLDAAAEGPDDDLALARAEAAVAEAERAQLAAIDALEVAYRGRRGGLEPTVAARYDATFASTRRTLADARRAAGDDLEARWLLLDAYAAHRRSLQTIVQGLEVSP